MTQDNQDKRESHSTARSMAKGLSWRGVATLTTVAISYWLTGALTAALKIGPLDFVVKLLVFYAHERLWLLDAMQALEHKRALKMCLWKVLALSMTTLTTVVVTGNLNLALKLGPADFFAKLFLYYGHEMLWDHISFGLTVTNVSKKET